MVSNILHDQSKTCLELKIIRKASKNQFFTCHAFKLSKLPYESNLELGLINLWSNHSNIIIIPHVYDPDHQQLTVTRFTSKSSFYFWTVQVDLAGTIWGDLKQAYHSHSFHTCRWCSNKQEIRSGNKFAASSILTFTGMNTNFELYDSLHQLKKTHGRFLSALITINNPQ